MVDSYETWVMIWRCGPATTHSPSAKKIITNVGGQPFGTFFRTLRPQMKTRGYLKPTKIKKTAKLYSFLPEKIKLKNLPQLQCTLSVPQLEWVGPKEMAVAGPRSGGDRECAL
jgi:hypothetical protein